MRQIIDVTPEISIVLTFGECNYEEVLVTLEKAKWVDIATYNISKEDRLLHDLLSQKCKGVPVRFITKIPNWFDYYYGPKPKKTFKDTFAIYHKALDPSKYGCMLLPFFNVRNHSKIIISDLVAYIGSGNFSAESSDNYECGVIFRNPQIIEQIRAEIVGGVLEGSFPRDVTDIGKAKMFFQQLHNDFPKRIAILEDDFHTTNDDYISSVRVNWQEAEVSKENLKEILAFIDQLGVELKAYGDHHHFAAISDMLPQDLLDSIRELTEDSGSYLVKLSEFNLNDSTQYHMSKILSGRYGHNTDACAQSASEYAQNEREALISAAYNSFMELKDLVVKVKQRIKDILVVLNKLEKTTWGVDNA